MIECKEWAYFVTNLLGSRHGTWLNGEQLAPGAAREIRDRDRIGLARDEVVLTFVTAVLTGSETWDYPESQPGPRAVQKPGSPVILDQDRRKVTLDGRPLALSGKLYDLLCLLYENWGRAVGDRDIKEAVWHERGLGSDGMPLVTDEELTTLVYRLRKRLEPHGDLIHTVPGYGLHARPGIRPACFMTWQATKAVILLSGSCDGRHPKNDVRSRPEQPTAGSYPLAGDHVGTTHDKEAP